MIRVNATLLFKKQFVAYKMYDNVLKVVSMEDHVTRILKYCETIFNIQKRIIEKLKIKVVRYY